MPERPSGTVTFLFTDIESSTRRWEERPDLMKDATSRHDALLRSVIEAHGGYIFKQIGDAFCAAFDTAPPALETALDIHRALAGENWGDIGSLRVRIALHTGAAEEQEGNYSGPTLDRAMRLLSAAHGGQTIMTIATRQLLGDRAAGDVEFVDMGERQLRDLTHKEHIFQAAAPGLPVDFPPLKTLEGRPNNLPVRTTILIGREKEVLDCCNLLRSPSVRLLTLTGPGGIGKTRLALHVAAMLLDDFADGVFFVSLASVIDADLVTASIAQALGVMESGGQTLLQRLKDHLRARQMLLVLDNFERLLLEAPLVWELLSSAPGLKVLVTSRAVLNISVEQEYQVPPLTVPVAPAAHDTGQEIDLAGLAGYEAVALFVSRAMSVRNDFRLTKENARAVAEICSLLEGLPLAIELAAARVRLLPPQAMLSRLAGAHGADASRLKLLTGGGRDMPARQQTMRATFEWSYDLLDEGERALFRRLSVFVRGCDFEAAEVVCDPQSGDLEQAVSLTGPRPPAPDPLGIDVLDGLSSLVDKSFLRQERREDGEVRFRMLEILREYGMEKLAEVGEDQAITRQHALYCLQLVETAEPELTGPRQEEWIVRLEDEHENLRAAIEWANEHKESELGLRLAGAMWRFWYMRGYLTEGAKWLLGLLALPGAQARDRWRAKALKAAGNLMYNLGDYDSSRAVHAESLDISTELGDRQSVAASLNNLGLISRNLGDHAEARAYFEDARRINREMGNRPWEAVNLNNLATVYHQHGDWPQARALQEESLALFTALGDKWGMAMSLADLGKVVSDQADYARARELYERALALQQEIGDKRNTADILTALGQIAWKQSDYPQASRIFTQALAAFRDLGDRKGIGSALNYLGNVAWYSGHVEEARRLYDQSLAIRLELKDKRDLAASNNNIGLVALELKDYAQAQDSLALAVKMWRDVGDRERTATSLANLGRVALARNDHEKARSLFEESLGLAKEAQDKWSVAYALSGLGQLAFDEGDSRRAEELFKESLQLRYEVGDRRSVARTLMGLARVAWDQGQVRRVIRLAAAGRALFDAIGSGLDAVHQADYEKVLSALPGHYIDPKELDTIWEEWKSRPVEDVIDYALHGKANGNSVARGKANGSANGSEGASAPAGRALEEVIE